MTAKALVISPETPYPVEGGGALRTASILEYLLARGFAVDLILFGIEGGWDPRNAIPLPRFGSVHLVLLPPHSASEFARFARNGWRLIRGAPPLLHRFAGLESQLERWLTGRRYDVAILEHFWIASYGPLVRRYANKLILDLHNVESEWHRTMAAHEPWLTASAHRRFARLYERLEHDLLPIFDHVLSPAGPYTMYPNSIPWTPAPAEPASDPTIVFSGNFEHAPNQHGAGWFRHNVWPILREKCPDVRWRLVGRNQHEIAHELEPRMEATGAVPDAIAELGKSQVAVVPIRSGSGTRVKMIEAWAAQLPVVSTSFGAEGLDARNGEHLLLADEPEYFASCVNLLLGDAGLRRRMGAAGRNLYENRYTWEKAWQLLDALPGFIR